MAGRFPTYKVLICCEQAACAARRSGHAREDFGLPDLMPLLCLPRACRPPCARRPWQVDCQRNRRAMRVATKRPLSLARNLVGTCYCSIVSVNERSWAKKKNSLERRHRSYLYCSTGRWSRSGWLDSDPAR